MTVSTIAPIRNNAVIWRDLVSSALIRSVCEWDTLHSDHLVMAQAECPERKQ